MHLTPSCKKMGASWQIHKLLCHHNSGCEVSVNHQLVNFNWKSAISHPLVLQRAVVQEFWTFSTEVGSLEHTLFYHKQL